MKFIRVALSFLLVFCAVFTLAFGWKKISSSKIDSESKSYQGVLSVWHVDGFEGGIGSRKQFLLNRGIEFEKQNEGVFVMVSNFSFEGLEERMEKGEYPDVISFSMGAKVDNASKLYATNLVGGGMIGDKAYATAWCRGGYVLIANANKVSDIPNTFDSITVSQAEYTQPLVAFVLEGLEAKNINVKQPMDAYYDFVNGKTDFLLGTQRDVMRLNNRNFEILTRPIGSFNDLIQYVSVTTKSAQKRELSQKFVQFLIEEQTQRKLNKIGMFSCFYSVEYEDLHYAKLNDVKSQSNFSAFISSVQLKEMQSVSKEVALGKKEGLNKIKNMLV